MWDFGYFSFHYFRNQWMDRCTPNTKVVAYIMDFKTKYSDLAIRTQIFFMKIPANCKLSLTLKNATGGCRNFLLKNLCSNCQMWVICLKVHNIGYNFCIGCTSIHSLVAEIMLSEITKISNWNALQGLLP